MFTTIISVIIIFVVADENSLLDEVTSHMASKRLPRVKDTSEIGETSRLKKSTSTHKSPKTSTSAGEMHIEHLQNLTNKLWIQ